MSVDGLGVDALEREVGSSTGDEEAPGLIEGVEAIEVEIAAVHHVESTGFGDEQVENVDVVQPAFGDVDEAGDTATQVEQRMKLHRGFGLSKVRPREQRQAQTDHRGVERVDGFVQVYALRLTTQTDFALRTLMYLAANGERVTAGQVAELFGISEIKSLTP